MAAILFALVAHVGWATGDILGATVSRKIGGYSTTFWSYVVRIPVLALYLPFDLENVRAVTLLDIGVSGALSVVALVGTVFFFDAFRGGNASLVGTIGSAFTVPTVILSVIFFGERLDAYQTFAIVVIVVGLVITSLDLGTLRQGVGLDRSVGMALLAMLCWGIYYALIRIPVERIGWFLPTYISFFFAPFVLLLMRMQRVPLRSPLAEGAGMAFIGMQVLVTAANFGYNIGITSGYTSIVAPIAGAYPILFVFISALTFKEPLKAQQLWGIVISLVGILALSLWS
jgi:drug/metabolite transporter (DMT)-like permease